MAEDIWGPNEVKERRMSLRKSLVIWSRPFYMLTTEAIVAWLSTVSGFSVNLIIIFLQASKPVYEQWGVGTIGNSLAFLP